jgi:hypothetical protein
VKLIPQEDLQRAREMDLLTYLTYYDPGNLRHVSGNVYSTVEHDSLIINNGKWCWFSQGIGGYNALDYLIKVRGIPFRTAVEKIIGSITEPLPTPFKPHAETPKVFVMPKLSSDTTRVMRYLTGRGIDPEIIQWCIDRKLLFETADYGNALFIGYDSAGNPKYGAVRSTTGSFKGDAKGSDKRFAFRIVKAKQPKSVHVFEAVPDLLSYATLVKMEGANWHMESYLSLAGIGVGKTIPKALEQFLKTYPEIDTIHLRLDNDDIGRGAAEGIIRGLGDVYTVIDAPPTYGKDMNDELQFKIKSLRKETHER